MDNPIIIVLILAALAILICVIAAIVKFKRSKTSITEQIRAAEDARLECEPEYTSLTVEVVDLACEARSVGRRLPRLEKEFRVAFRAESGECFDLAVGEELYFAFEKGQRGSLTLVDGELYSFLADEEKAE